MYNKANFFWVGKLSIYEILSLKSFLANGFEISFWTYEEKIENLYLLRDLNIKIKDASEILDIKLIEKFSQGKQKASPASFANLFRLEVLLKNGGWWFDLDCICLKNAENFKQLVSDKDYILGREYENYIGNSVMYFSKPEIAQELVRNINQLASEKNYTFYWGEIGPDLITNYFSKNKLMESTLDEKYFYSVKAKNFNYFLKTNSKDRNLIEHQLKDSYVCHTWNEMMRKYNYNKNNLPPKFSYLGKLFSKYYQNAPSKKRYSNLVNVRFVYGFGFLNKLFYRIKILLKNRKVRHN